MRWIFILLTLAAIASTALMLLIAPRTGVKPPKYGFLADGTHLKHVPEIDMWSVCDIYSFEGPLEDIKRRVDADVGAQFERRHAFWNGVSWYSPKDGSGREITIYARRSWIDKDGQMQQEPSKTWVSAYVYYGKQRVEAPSFDSSRLIGKWRNEENLPHWFSTVEFRPDGRYVWVVDKAHKKEPEISTGTFRVEGGNLIHEQDPAMRASRHSDDRSWSAPRMVTPIFWVSKDSFEWGEREPRQLWKRDRNQ